MSRKVLTMITVWTLLFAAAGIFAGTAADDVIRMENKAYEKHEKTVMCFPHKKHIEDFALGCGECHHDADNKPLCELKIGDTVQNCIECHKKPAYIKGKDAKGLTPQQKREYHANAVHDSCRGCHKKTNGEKGLKSSDPGAAPTACKQCHPNE